MAAVTAIKRAFTYQAVYTGFGAQPAVGIFAAKFNGTAFNTGHIAVGYFVQFRLKAFVFTPAQVHAH